MYWEEDDFYSEYEDDEYDLSTFECSEYLDDGYIRLVVLYECPNCRNKWVEYDTSPNLSCPCSICNMDTETLGYIDTELNEDIIVTEDGNIDILDLDSVKDDEWIMILDNLEY